MSELCQQIFTQRAISFETTECCMKSIPTSIWPVERLVPVVVVISVVVAEIAMVVVLLIVVISIQVFKGSKLN